MPRENFKTLQEAQAYADELNAGWFSEDKSVRIASSIYGTSEGDDPVVTIGITLETIIGLGVFEEVVVESMRLFSPGDTHAIYLAVAGIKSAYNKGLAIGKYKARKAILSHFDVIMGGSGG